MDKGFYGLGALAALVGIWLLWQGGTQPEGSGIGEGSFGLFVFGGALVLASALFAAIGRALELLGSIARATAVTAAANASTVRI